METLTGVDRDLEDLTVYRYRTLLHAWLGQKEHRLQELYENIRPEITQQTFLDRIRGELLQIGGIPPGLALARYRWLAWLILERWSSEELDRLRRSQDQLLHLVPRDLRSIHTTLFSSSSPTGLIEFVDRTNPQRIRWFKAWKFGYDQLSAKHSFNPAILATEPLPAWRTLRDQILEDLTARFHSIIYKIQKGQDYSHWSDLRIPRFEGYRLFQPLMRQPEHWVHDLWQDLLGFPTDLQADFQWQILDNGKLFGPPRVYFDGEILHMVIYRDEKIPLDRLFAWGQAQPALWTPLTYPWFRLAGGDPSIPRAWGYWLSRWFLRRSGWRAIDRELFYERARLWFDYIETLLTYFLTAVWVFYFEAMHTHPDRLGTIHENWTRQLGEWFGVRFEPEISLPLGLNRGYFFIEFRAWVLAGAIHDYLEWVYGLDWYKKREARYLLTDFWEMGTDYTVESALKEWGQPLPFEDEPNDRMTS